uniref:Uncharacterized protein n=1 Tax=Anguilla anguilla TaxID=7936 RepID=A0A0E9QIV8_ANGAN
MQCTRVAFIVELASNILIFTSLLLTKDLILLPVDGGVGAVCITQLECNPSSSNV